MENKGVSLISLIITIIVIIILASIAVFSSMDTIEQSQLVKNESEFENVCTFVRDISSRAEGGLIELTLTKDTLATANQIRSFVVPSGEFNSEDQNKIYSLNESRKDTNPNLGYHYIKGKDIENDTIKGMEGFCSSTEGITLPKSVSNDYLINFTYGVIVAVISPTRNEISGKIR